MGINKHRPHVLVLPEDEANRQLANGFLLHPNLNATCIDVRPPCGGWVKVLEDLKTTQSDGLRKYSLRHLVVLVDFDKVFDTRFKKFRKECPQDVSGRVYVLGTYSEPEPLRAAVGKPLEAIGMGLADACAGKDPGLWDHALLKHNDPELVRLTAGVRPFLFQ
jgi:hypothetical protein